MGQNIGYIEKAAITILVEDLAGYDSNLSARFGLSILIDAFSGEQKTQILYDTNQSAEPIIQNLKTLGLSLDKLNSIFLSHCHFDHTGGLTGVLDFLQRPIPVIGHPSLFRPCFEMKPEGLWPIGLLGTSQSDLEQRNALLMLVKEPIRLMQGIISSGEIPRVTDFELPQEMYTIRDGIIVQDEIIDDAALILNFQQGLVLLVGCCHAGIINTILHAKAITGVNKIHAIIGGLHLLNASQYQLDRTLEALEEVDYLFTGHCTGFKPMVALMQAKGSKFQQIHTGKIIHLPVR